MNLAIVGHGKMGRMIEQLAPQYGFNVRLKLDEFNNEDLAGMTAENFNGVDVAVEFSTPSATVPNIERLAELGVNVVVGTTGWLRDLDRVREIVMERNIGLVWSPNYSVGVNVMFRLAAEAARVMAGQLEYGAWGWEIHHGSKKDAPSGTLLKLVEEIQAAGFGRKVDVSSNRAGSHPGTHEIGFDSAADTLTIRHTARGREGFGRGALQAAAWLVGKKGFYEFSDILFAPRPA